MKDALGESSFTQDREDAPNRGQMRDNWWTVTDATFVSRLLTAPEMEHRPISSQSNKARPEHPLSNQWHYHGDSKEGAKHNELSMAFLPPSFPWIRCIAQEPDPYSMDCA